MLTKTRHNKKRNTAFIYEALVRELTKCVIAKDEGRKAIIVSLVKEHFAKGSPLREELDLYKALYETEDLEAHMCEKLIYEVKRSHNSLNKAEIFKEQSTLISKINKMLSKDVFANFVPNYKTLATISQMFSDRISPKEQVILENHVVHNMLQEAPSEELETPMDGVVVKTFVEKFNKKYEGELLAEQKDLLTRYITSFVDNALELKIYLNEEIARLKEELSKATEVEEIKSDESMLKKTNEVLALLESFAQVEITDEVLLTVLKTQALVKEITTDGHND